MAELSLKEKLAWLSEQYNWEYIGGKATYHSFKKRGEKSLIELTISKSGHGFCDIKFSYITDNDEIESHILEPSDFSSLKNMRIRKQTVDISVRQIFENVTPAKVYESLLEKKHLRIRRLQERLDINKTELKKLEKLKTYFV